MTIEFPAAARIAGEIPRQPPSPSELYLVGARANAVGALALERLAPRLTTPASAKASISSASSPPHSRPGCPVERHSRARLSPGATAYDASALPRVSRRLRRAPIPGLGPRQGWRIKSPSLTHRGCPFECNFCGHNSWFKPRYRSPENVLAEMEHVVAHFFKPRVIRIEDETFGLNLPRTKQILGRYPASD